MSYKFAEQNDQNHFKLMFLFVVHVLLKKKNLQELTLKSEV